MIQPIFSLVKLGPANTSLPKLLANKLLIGIILSIDSLFETHDVFQETA